MLHQPPFPLADSDCFMYFGLQSCQTSCRESDSFLIPSYSPAWPLFIWMYSTMVLYLLLSSARAPCDVGSAGSPTAVLFPPPLPCLPLLTDPWQQWIGNSCTDRKRWEWTEDDKKKRKESNAGERGGAQELLRLLETSYWGIDAQQEMRNPRPWTGRCQISLSSRYQWKKGIYSVKVASYGLNCISDVPGLFRESLYVLSLKMLNMSSFLGPFDKN